jgi:hypothetical protein
MGRKQHPAKGSVSFGSGNLRKAELAAAFTKSEQDLSLERLCVDFESGSI